MTRRARRSWIARPRWQDLVLVVAALTAIVALRNAEPNYTERLLPIMVHGKVGQRVEARNFAVSVKRAKLARAYLVDGRGSDAPPRRVETSGVWMSVLAEVEALQAPGLVGARILTRDGLVYQGNSDRPPVVVNFTSLRLEPGLPMTGAWFFELPEDQVEGARLQVFWGSYEGLGGIDHMLDIDLGIDAADTRTLLAEAPDPLDLRG